MWRLRHCDDALSTSSSLIACTVRFASRSPWKPAEKPIDSLSLDSSERELFQESLGPFPLLSYPRRISLVFARGEAFASPTRGSTRLPRVFRRSREKQGRKNRVVKEKEEEEEKGEEENER